MQRLHEDDLAGTLLAAEWPHLYLPAIAEEDEQVAIGPSAFHQRRKGEALHPERESLEVLAGIKREMGSLAFSAQYLQRPVPTEGNLIRRQWFQWFDPPLARGLGAQIVQSWDLATSTGVTNDWSVCTTWMMHNRNYYLLDVWRRRVEFPTLRHQVAELARIHGANRILIENVGPGQHLLQELRAHPFVGVPMPIGIRPLSDKIVRMEAGSARFEAGQVHLPRDAPWLDDLLHEFLAFPNSRHDDQIDSTSQFLNWAETYHEPLVSLFGPEVFTGRPLG